MVQPAVQSNATGKADAQSNIVHSTAIHSPRCSTFVSKTHSITWTIENIDSGKDQITLRSQEFPENVSLRLYVKVVKQWSESVPKLTFSLFKSGEPDKKLEGGLLLDHRPLVTFHDGQDEVGGKFNEDSEVVIEMSEEWKEKFVRKGVLKVGCSVRESGHDLDLGDDSSDLVLQRELVSDLKKLLSPGLNSDLQLKSKDGYVYKAHKLILSARSAVFKAILASQPPDVLQVPYFSATTQALLDFIYSGSCDPKYFTYDTMTAADDYALPGLKRRIEQHLATAVNNANVLDTMLSATSHSAHLLQEACVSYIITNKLSQTITKSAKWEALDKTLKLSIGTRLLHL